MIRNSQGTGYFSTCTESTLQIFKLGRANLAGITTDGCPSIVGENDGVDALVQK